MTTVRRRHDMTPEVEPERWAILNFVRDGAPLLRIDVRNCPLGIPAFGHWRPDGTCRCGGAS